MIKHRIETVKKSDTVADQIELPDNQLVIEIPALTNKVATKISDYLYETIDSRIEFDSVFGAMPIQIQIDGQLRITERALWNMLVELDGAQDWVSYYVAAAIEASEDTLPPYTQVDILGQEPVYAYIDRWFRRSVGNVSKVPDEHHVVIDAFEAFLESCDLMHECNQNDYINIVIDYLWSEPNRAADFIALRLTEGQYVDFKGSIKQHVLEPGMFKNVVLKYVDFDELEDIPFYELFALCAHVYGNNKQAVMDVLESILDDDVEDFESQWQEQDRAFEERDIELDLQENRIDTGFHLFDPETKTWQRK